MLLHTSLPFSTFFSFLVFLLLMVYTLRFRKAPGANYFIISMFFSAVLAVASIGELLSTGLPVKLLWRNFEQFPLFFAPLCLYGMVMELTGIEVRKVRKQLVWLALPCVIYLLLIFTDPLHHLMRSHIDLEPFGDAFRVRIQSTKLSMLFIFYTRIVGAIAIIRLLYSLRSVSRYNRIQYWLILASAIIPLLFNTLANFLPFEASVSVSSVPGGLLLCLAIFHYKLLRVRPVAKDIIIEHMNEGVLVIDTNGIILDVNPSAKRLIEQIGLNASGRKLLGSNLRSLLDMRPHLLVQYDHKDTTESAEYRVDLPPYHYSVSLIPIRSRNQQIGTLFICTDISERVAYEEELVKRATIDGLTQVFNRQHVLEQTAIWMSQHDLLSFLLIDIDYFKSINDQYGHRAGDEALAQVAAIIRDTVGAKGMVGRMGGEEFAAALPQVDLPEALAIAERVRHNVEQAEISNHEDGTLIRCTVSIGVTATRAVQSSFTDIYQEADDLLYRSKHKGRNQITAPR